MGDRTRLVEMAEVLMDGWKYRDDDCNRIEVDWGKPGYNGLFSPTVRIVYTDNPLVTAKAEIERLKKVPDQPHPWSLTVEEAVQLSRAMNRSTAAAASSAVNDFDRELDRHGLMIKTRGLRWRIALLRALKHGAATGHGGLWTIGPDNSTGRPVVRCPDCGKSSPLSVEKKR